MNRLESVPPAATPADLFPAPAPKPEGTKPDFKNVFGAEKERVERSPHAEAPGRSSSNAATGENVATTDKESGATTRTVVKSDGVATHEEKHDVAQRSAQTSTSAPISVRDRTERTVEPEEKADETAVDESASRPPAGAVPIIWIENKVLVPVERVPSGPMPVDRLERVGADGPTDPGIDTAGRRRTNAVDRSMPIGPETAEARQPAPVEAEKSRPEESALPAKGPVNQKDTSPATSPEIRAEVEDTTPATQESDREVSGRDDRNKVPEGSTAPSIHRQTSKYPAELNSEPAEPRPTLKLEPYVDAPAPPSTKRTVADRDAPVIPEKRMTEITAAEPATPPPAGHPTGQPAPADKLVEAAPPMDSSPEISRSASAPAKNLRTAASPTEAPPPVARRSQPPAPERLVPETAEARPVAALSGVAGVAPGPDDSGVGGFTKQDTKSTPDDGPDMGRAGASVTADPAALSKTERSTASPAPVDSERPHALDATLIQELAQRMRAHVQSAGRNEIRMALYPENLGEIRLRATLEGNRVSAAILTDSAEARDFLDRHLPLLQAALSERGLNVERLEIQHNTGMTGTLSGDGRSSAQHERPPQTSNPTGYGSTPEFSGAADARDIVASTPLVGGSGIINLLA